MIDLTRRMVKLALENDSTITKDQIAEAMKVLEGTPVNRYVPRTIRVREAAEKLAVTPRTLQNLAKKNVLTPVYGSGTHRCIGYTEESVRKACEARQ